MLSASSGYWSYIDPTILASRVAIPVYDFAGKVSIYIMIRVGPLSVCIYVCMYVCEQTPPRPLHQFTSFLVKL